MSGQAVKKAPAQPARDVPRAILDVADLLEPQMATAFLESIKSIQDNMSLEDLAQALIDGDVTAAEVAAGLDTVEATMAESMPTIVRQAFTQAAENVADIIDEDLGVGFAFNLVNPEAVDFAQHEVGNRITEVAHDTVEAIRDIIKDSVGGKVGRVEPVVNRIKDVVGLRSDQIDAVQSYRDQLLEDGTDPVEAELKATKYAHELLKDRSLLIARTEIINATNAGAMQAFGQAMKAGWIDPDTAMVEWIATDDEKTCPICSELDGQQVAYGDQFTTQDGDTFDNPGAHPSCRCSVALVPMTAEQIAAGQQEAADFHAPVVKYSPDQPRVPSGSADGGQWSGGGGGGVVVDSAPATVGYHPASDTITLLHGTSAANAANIRAHGFRPLNAHEMAAYVEDEVGLPRDSVYNHPSYHFETQTRQGDQRVYFTSSPETATHYGAPESLTDALGAAFLVQHPDWGTSIDPAQSTDDRMARERFIHEWTAKLTQPEMLAVTMPWKLVGDTYNWQRLGRGPTMQEFRDLMGEEMPDNVAIPASKLGGVHVAPSAHHQKRHAPVIKFNPNHEPAGSPEGGQFAAGDAGAGGGRSEYADAPRVFHTPDDVEHVAGSWGDASYWQWRAEPGHQLTGMPLDRANVPATLYHTTTNASAVMRSGVLLGQHGDAGLGGGQADGVSFTSDLNDARVIQRELVRSVNLLHGTDTFDSFPGYARADEAEAGLAHGALDHAVDFARTFYDANRQNTSVYGTEAAMRGLAYEALSSYLQIRDSDFGKQYPVLKNPLLFGNKKALAKLDAGNIKVLAVPSANIPEKALITTGSDDFLHEVRAYADVPVKQATIVRFWHAPVVKFNPNHAPAGGPDGGQFTSGGGAESSGDKPEPHAPVVGYHVAPSAKDSVIGRDGLRAGTAAGGKIYVWDSLGMARWFADFQNDANEARTIWRVNLKGLKLSPDPETADMSDWSNQFAPGEPGGGWIVSRPIPAHRIERAKSHAPVVKFNPNHAPAGGPDGGQFTEGPGGTIEDQAASGPDIFYHGTSEEVAASILREGLQVAHAGDTWPGMAQKGSVYISNSLDATKSWAMSAVDDRSYKDPEKWAMLRPVIFQVHVPNKERDRIIVDRHFAPGGHEKPSLANYEFRGDIPPEWIEHAWIGDPFREGNFQTLEAPVIWHRIKAEDWQTLYIALILEPAPTKSHAPVVKFRDDQPRVPAGQADGGQWTSGGGMAGLSPEDRQALADHLVDFKPGERPLHGPDAVAIGSIIPDARTTGYLDVPGIDTMHRLMGIPHPTLQTDPVAYAAKRDTLFRAQPIDMVPFRRLVYTQETLNQHRLYELTGLPHTLDQPVYVIRTPSHDYLMNGHHRVAAAFLAGRATVNAYVLDTTAAGKWTVLAERKVVRGYPEFDPDEDRDDHGRWSGGGSASASFGEFQARLRRPDGGFSVSAVTGEEPSTGFMVSPYGALQKIVQPGHMSAGTIATYMAAHAKELSRPNHFLGGWHDPKTGLLYLDVAVVVDTEADAVKLAQEHHQISYFDLRRGRSVDTPHLPASPTSGKLSRARRNHGRYRAEADAASGRTHPGGRARPGAQVNGARAHRGGSGGSQGGPGAGGAAADIRIAHMPVVRSLAPRTARQPVIKYSDDQPRVPAGSPDGGQWTSGGSNGGAGESPSSSQAGGLPHGGGVSGSHGWMESPGGATPAIEQRLDGAPTTAVIPGRGVVPVEPFAPARQAARDYMAAAGLPYHPPTTYVKVDPAVATKIAAEYDKMVHAPNDPEVKAAYDAMIRETIAQYQFIKATGLKVDFIDYAKNGDPYAASPRMATMDVIEHNHLWVFPTDDGFGSSNFDASANPLLAMTNEYVNGKQLRANDVFRIVHDYFGHIKDGNGFRADGEENAWRSHGAMYSPIARRAMTSETRGQNSWVNYGPHGEANRTASGADTVFADQKTGLLPLWVSNPRPEKMHWPVVRFNPNHEPAGSPTGGQFAEGPGGGGGTATLNESQQKLAGFFETQLTRAIGSEYLGENTATRYREALDQVVRGMPRDAIDAFLGRIGKIDFMGTMSRVREEWIIDATEQRDPSIPEASFEEWAKEASRFVGAFTRNDDPARVVVDGDYGKALQGVADAPTLAYIYAHEFGHVVDGTLVAVDGSHETNTRLSKSHEWISAWKYEIKAQESAAHPLSRYASSSAGEGFAEFFAFATLHPTEAKAKFPESWGVLHARGYA